MRVFIAFGFLPHRTKADLEGGMPDEERTSICDLYHIMLVTAIGG